MGLFVALVLLVLREAIPDVAPIDPWLTAALHTAGSRIQIVYLLGAIQAIKSVFFACLAGISSPNVADGAAEQSPQFAGFPGSSLTRSGLRDEDSARRL